MNEGDDLPQDDAGEPGMRLGTRTKTMIVASAVAFVLLALVFTLPMPFTTMRPGPVFNTLGKVDGKQLISVGDGVETHPTKGELNFTTVSVSRSQTRVTLPTVLVSWLDPNVMVLPHDLVYPNAESDKEASEQGAAELANSQDASKVAAVRATGREVTEHVEVAAVTAGSPADGALQVGDVILAVDGAAVSDAADVGERIGNRRPGEDVVLKVERDGTEQSFTVTTKKLRGSDRPRVGVTVSPKYDLPFPITNSIGDRVGGPSAGMMFALAIYDKLTPGPLTGGLDIAGTGTIDADGTVGEIGGVRQKMVGAQRAGSTVFLLPKANCGEALEQKTDMTLVPVATLDDAISAVGKLAKDHDAKVPSCR